MADISPITLQVAQLQGHAMYEAAASGWGYSGTAVGFPQTNGLGYGNLSIIGAQVHPRSEVEGFRLRWSPLPQQPSQILPPDTIATNDYFVMRDKPFEGRLQGPISILPLPQDFYADVFLRTGTGTGLFGGAFPAGATFDQPEMWAMLWLKNEGIRSVGARTHYRIGPNTRTLSGFGTQDLVAALPISGRKNVRILLTSVAVPDSPGSAAVPVNVKISGLAGNNTGIGIGLANRLQEYEIQSAHVPAQATVPVYLPYTPHQWLLIQAEVEQTTPGALLWRVDASDYP